jgi:hypothetical protein
MRPGGRVIMIRTIIIGAVAALLGYGVLAATNYDGGPQALYQALAEQPHETLRLGGGEIEVVFADGAPGLDRGPVLAWIEGSAEAAIAYFGRFPVAKVGLLVIADDGDRIGGGTTFGHRGSAIRIHVGRKAGAEAFERDWKMVHEMVHLALPRVVPQESANWMMEGSATYVEPIARALAGHLSEQAVWRTVWTACPRASRDRVRAASTIIQAGAGPIGAARPSGCWPMSGSARKPLIVWA